MSEGLRQRRHPPVGPSAPKAGFGLYEMKKRGLADGDRVDLITESTDCVERIVHNFRVVGYSFPNGRRAAYYAETNPRVPLYSRDPVIRKLSEALATSRARPSLRGLCGCAALGDFDSAIQYPGSS
jgi:hypothetical protein